jgi:hypothetical protein
MRLKQALVTQALVKQALAAALVVGLAYAVAPAQAHHAVQRSRRQPDGREEGTLVKID